MIADTGRKPLKMKNTIVLSELRADMMLEGREGLDVSLNNNGYKMLDSCVSKLLPTEALSVNQSLQIAIPF